MVDIEVPVSVFCLMKCVLREHSRRTSPVAPVVKKPPVSAGDARDGGVKSGTRLKGPSKATLQAS